MIGVLPSELAFLSSPQQSLTLAENEVKRLDALEKRIPDQVCNLATQHFN